MNKLEREVFEKIGDALNELPPDSRVRVLRAVAILYNIELVEVENG